MVVGATLLLAAAIVALVLYASRRAGVGQTTGYGSDAGLMPVLTSIDAASQSTSSQCDVGSVDCGGHGGH